MNNDSNKLEDERPDLKHDTMEFAASTEGDELLDPAVINDEEEMITSEELEMLEDDPEIEAAALEAVEEDLQTDEDNLHEEDWLDDIPGGDANEEEADEDAG